MKRLFWMLSIIGLISCNNSPRENFLGNNDFKIALDNKGQLTELLEKKTGKNLLVPNYKVSLLTVHANGKEYPISSWKSQDDVLNFKFNGIEAEINVKYQSKKHHLTFEIIDIKSPNTIEKVSLGPYHVLPSEKIGKSIGIAYNDTIAIGLMGLNLKSRGGFEMIKNERFGNTAQKIDGGASLTGFVRNRSVSRVADNHEQAFGVVTAIDDEDAHIKGAKFALYCVPSKDLRSVIEDITIQENLPYIKTKGVWNKVSNYSTSSKFIMSFNRDNIEDCINIAKKAGMTCIYHGGIFTSWGHFNISEKNFPKGYQSVKECSDLAEKEGINLGAHMLTNFITTNDAYVSPKPHPELVLAGITKLSNGISSSTNELILEDAAMRAAYYEPNLDKVDPRWRKHTAVRIGDEIIEYAYATKDGQLILKDCKRGAFGTKAVEHKKGEQVARLASHGYKVFFPNLNLQDEMAKNLANFFNEANIKRISFDGIEGGLVSGHGRYAGDRFVKVFFDHLKDPHILANSSDVTHFGWHYFANQSWGEPWTSDNFRESHLDHRIKVQKSLKEDLLPRKMGQFSIKSKTTKKDIEWVMGLCAGYDAGVDFYISPNFEKINKNADAILSEIKKWEEARMQGLFTEAQKEKLRDPYTFYGLEQDEEGIRLVFIESWKPKEKSTEVIRVNSLPETILKSSAEATVSEDYKHRHLVTEPGKPTSSTWSYFCEGSKQNLQYVIRHSKTSEKPVKGIYLKVGTQNIKVPYTLESGDYIINKGNETLYHYSEKHQLKNQSTSSEYSLMVNNGKNIIEIDYEADDNPNNPEVIVNFKTKN